MNNYIILLLIGVLVGIGTALPFFNNEPRDFRAGAPVIDEIWNLAPAEQNEFVSSSASGYDSTPSDGGGDTNPTAPTAGPGGSPTQASKKPVLFTNQAVGGITAGVILGLALVVVIAVVIAIYVIKKKGYVEH